jgi:hypothetical protein
VTRKNLIVGTIMHYDFDRVEPFFSSLSSTKYSGDVVLFYSGVPLWTIKLLRRKGAILIPFERSFPHLEPSLAKHASRWADSKRVHILGVHCLRYLLAYCYLNEFAQTYRHVMLTDVRDVIFQSDPFNFHISDKLCCFTEREGLSLGQQPLNCKWVQLAFDTDTLNQLRNKPIVCSGITIGPSNLVLAYSAKMVDLFLSAHGKGWEAATPGIDQAVHNYIVYEGLLPEIEVYPNDAGPVLTLGLEESVSLNRSGRLVNKRGMVPNIVHQYDRHWHVAKRLYTIRTIWKYHGGSRAVISTSLSIYAPTLHQRLLRLRDITRSIRSVLATHWNRISSAIRNVR